MTKDLKEKIKELEKEKAKLTESDEQYKLIVENANDVIFITDLRSKIININRRIQDVIGYKPEELIGTNMVKLFPKHYLIELAMKTKNLLTEGCALVKNAPVKTKDKNIRYAEVQLTVLKKNNKPYALVGIGRDVTERKKYEENLKEKMDALERYNKIAVGREHKMIELKERIRELEEKLAEK